MSVAATAPPAEAPREIRGVDYPWWEDDPMVQGDWHYMVAKEAMNMVEALLSDRPAARAFGDAFIYWEKGNKRKKHAPDLFVLPEIDEPERERRSVLLWEERSRPVFVLEVLSEGTMRRDFGPKYDAYEQEIGVPEYFLCDPSCRPVRIWAYRLEESGYAPLEPDDEDRFWSEQLRAWFGADERGLLRVWDASGRRMLTHGEAIRLAVDEAERARAEAERAAEEARRAAAAEARVRELEQELQRRQ